MTSYTRGGLVSETSMEAPSMEIENESETPTKLVVHVPPRYRCKIVMKPLASGGDLILPPSTWAPLPAPEYTGGESYTPLLWATGWVPGGEEKNMSSEHGSAKPQRQLTPWAHLLLVGLSFLILMSSTVVCLLAVVVPGFHGGWYWSLAGLILSLTLLWPVLMELRFMRKLGIW